MEFQQIIRCNEDRLIMHPAVQRLIIKKRELYGNRQFYSQLLVNFVFTMIWTILTASFPLTDPKKNNNGIFYDSDTSIMAYPRMVLEIIGLALALYIVICLKLDSSRIAEKFTQYKMMRMIETTREYQYCHPRYPQEQNLVKDRIESYSTQDPASLYDAWYYMDVSAILGLVAVTLTRLLVLVWSSKGSFIRAHEIIYVITIIILWMRFMKSFRPFIALGPFIAMLGFVVKDTLKFACLFLEFYIPYVCALWVIFGGYAGPQWETFLRVCYEVFRMTLVDSFHFGELTKASITEPKLPAELIAGTYFALVSIACFNLYIALISETFSSVLGNATATAFMLQGEVLISCEQKMSYTNLSRLKNFIESTCSPEEVLEEGSVGDKEGGALREIKSDLKALRRQVEKVKKNQTSVKKTVGTVIEKVEQILQQQTFLNTKMNELTSLGSENPERPESDNKMTNSVARLQMQEISSVFGK